MILGKRPDIERFLSRPDPQIRAALIYGRDLGVVRERGQELAPFERFKSEAPEKASPALGDSAEGERNAHGRLLRSR